jgi:hypothetical protein
VIVGAGDLEVALEYVQRGGVLGMLIMVTLGTVRRWWFPAWYVRELEDDRNQWKELALQGTRIAERQTSLVEQAVERGRHARR